MSNETISLIIAFAALLFSLLSPIVSAFISGRYRLKEKQLESEIEQKKQYRTFYEEHRAQVIEKYLNAVGRACKSSSYDVLADYGEASGEIYFYVDESLWPLLDRINAKLTYHMYQSPAEEFLALCKALSTENIRSKQSAQPDCSDE